MDKFQMVGYILHRAVMSVVAVSLAIIAIVVFAMPAHAQPDCAPREMVIERITKQFGGFRFRQHSD